MNARSLVRQGNEFSDVGRSGVDDAVRRLFQRSYPVLRILEPNERSLDIANGSGEVVVVTRKPYTYLLSNELFQHGWPPCL